VLYVGQQRTLGRPQTERHGAAAVAVILRIIDDDVLIDEVSEGERCQARTLRRGRQALREVEFAYLQ